MVGKYYYTIQNSNFNVLKGLFLIFSIKIVLNIEYYDF